MNSAKKKQFFTAEEANSRLPLVRAIVTDIVAGYREVNERRELLNRIKQRGGVSRESRSTMHSEELEQVEVEIERQVERLEEFIEELQELGVELKDPAVGLVDFPSLIEGRERYLCWKLGEDEIAYWHELDAGFSGRQSLLELSLPGESGGSDDEETC